MGKNEVRFGQPTEPAPNSHRILHGLYETYKGVAPKNIQEAFHDALQAKEEAESLFNFGYLSLRERAQAERLFWHCCERILDRAREMKRMPEEVSTLEDLMASIYYCNFSVFQSVPDAWAIDQLFPVMPIHRLAERPTQHAVIGDITCDSDGKIDQFIDRRDVKKTLPLHAFNGEPYYLGVFLVGAYQEILGDLHNLYGDTHAVHVSLDDNDNIVVDEVVKGDTVREVLDYVEFDVERLVNKFRADIEAAVREGRVNDGEMGAMLRFYDEGLGGYTYLEEPARSKA